MFDVGVKQGKAPQVSFEYVEEDEGISNEQYLQNLIAGSSSMA